jgi:hypothetical protein
VTSAGLKLLLIIPGRSFDTGRRGILFPPALPWWVLLLFNPSATLNLNFNFQAPFGYNGRTIFL